MRCLPATCPEVHDAVSQNSYSTAEFRRSILDCIRVWSHVLGPNFLIGRVSAKKGAELFISKTVLPLFLRLIVNIVRPQIANLPNDVVFCLIRL